MVPDGIWMAMGAAVVCLLHTRVDGGKCAVQPKSTMAYNGVVGGPMAWAE